MPSASWALLDPSLAEAVVNDDVRDVSFVVRVLSADSANLNNVKRVRAVVHITGTKVMPSLLAKALLRLLMLTLHLYRGKPHTGQGGASAVEKHICEADGEHQGLACLHWKDQQEGGTFRFFPSCCIHLSFQPNGWPNAQCPYSWATACALH